MKALLIVDVQNDFCPGGALPVPDGDAVVPVINSLMDAFPLVLASKDWHPPQTVHFEKWPPHCVQGTPGAEFHPQLRTDKIQLVLLKGTGNRDDGYSAFEATNVNLAEYLRQQGVTELYITGLATDYCVRATTLDAVREGFRTYVVTDAVRAVNVNPGDGERALQEIQEAGAILVSSADVLKAQQAVTP
jgi:nicotinamidase/pyrazinamidase